MTKVSRLIPTSALASVAMSAREFGRSAPITPAVSPSADAMRIAVRPSATDTGSDEATIWLTVQSGYRSEGPKSSRKSTSRR